MSKHKSAEVQEIIDYVRLVIDQSGAVEEEQAFSAWVPAQGLLRIHFVSGKFDWKSVQARLGFWVDIFQGPSTAFCKEYTFLIRVGTFWSQLPPSNEV